MKTHILLFCLLLIGLRVSGQSQAETYIQEALGYLGQKEYKQAQLSLQDAINDINNILATQIVDALPAEINGLQAEGQGSANAGAMGMMGGGMQISKSYKHPSKPENDADVQIIANSPMMASMSMYLTNPGMLGQGYKSVRIGTQRAILKSEMQDYYGNSGASKQIRSSELQIPLTQTLITINMRGFATEADELAFANKLGIDALKTALGE